MSQFFRFPHTSHLHWLGDKAPRNNKVLSPDEVSDLLDGEVVVEEKIDGSNLGISLGTDGNFLLQKRGDNLYPPFTGEFKHLERWLHLHENKLFECLDMGLIAFGEWMAARHGLLFDKLPDWWILFDLYDRDEERFYSTHRRNKWARKAGVATVPEVAKGRFTLEGLIELLFDTQSRFRSGVLEGLIVRRENERWLEQRAKLVHADFVQTIGAHWSSKAMEWNRIDPEVPRYEHGRSASAKSSFSSA